MSRWHVFARIVAIVVGATGCPSTSSPAEIVVAQTVERAARAGIPAADMPALLPIAELAVDGGTIVRTQQRIDGLPVYRHELRALVDRAGRVVTSSGQLFDRRMLRTTRSLSLDERAATARAIEHATRRSSPTGPRIGQTRTRQVWYPHGDGLVIAWVVEAYVDDGLVRTIIDAHGRVLAHESLVADAAFTYKVFADPATKQPLDGPTADATPHPTGVPDDSYPGYVAQTLVSVESLNSPGDPWLPAVATSTSGNNVDAYADLSAPTGLGAGDFRATASGGVFDHAYDTSQGPLISQTQQMAAITSLFYVNNWLHDFWYDAGFSEAAGNAQASNYGRGGIDGDVLLAEAQDNALGGARNNANMATPDDGMSPRMQVFLWNGRDTRTMSLQPSGRTPAIGGAVFGPGEYDVTAGVIVGVDGNGVNPTDGCTAYSNDVTGKLVLVDRGNCTFKTKTLNAQNGGAAGLIVANNTAATTPPPMGDDSALAQPVTIPTVSVTQAEGVLLREEITAGTVTATIHRDVAVELDGSLDATLVAHEFGHYLHHRLSFCNTTMCRALSEGWGDFVALMLLARTGDDLTGAYPFSVYTTQGFGRDAGYYGIRRAPYSVDTGINALSFRHMADGEPLPTNHPMQASNDNSEVHNAGEVWAAALWEAYVALQQAGAGSGASFNAIRSKMARYVVAGLSLAPVDASPLATRNALLAVVLAADPADHATMIAAFARRGFGSCAIAPGATSIDFTGIVESSTIAGKPELGSAALADGCDEDGVLDTGETARINARITNQGHAPLTDVAVTMTSQLAGVTVISPPTTLARLEPFASVDVEIDVALEAGITEALAGDLALQVTAAGGCESVVIMPFATRVNIDDVPAAAAIDTFDTLGSAWAPWTIAWSHVRETALDGAWHGENLSIGSDTNLTSPYLVADAARPVTMTFTHRHRFEHSDGVAWDGGVVEYSNDNGATWRDAASIATVAYNGTVGDESSNTLSTRLAFVARNPAWPESETVTIDFGTAFEGARFQVRFRIGTDGATGDHGWDIDDVAFTGLRGTPFPAQRPDDGNCDPSSADDPIISGGGGCCDAGRGRASNGLFALVVLFAIGRRRHATGRSRPRSRA